jgi:hypothetical protein
VGLEEPVLLADEDLDAIADVLVLSHASTLHAAATAP